MLPSMLHCRPRDPKRLSGPARSQIKDHSVSLPTAHRRPPIFGDSFTRILLSSIPTFLSAMLNFWAPPKHARLFQALDLCPFPNNHLTHAPTYFSHPLRFRANILPTRKHSLVLAHPYPAPPATASWREAGDFFSPLIPAFLLKQSTYLFATLKCAFLGSLSLCISTQKHIYSI